MANNSNTPGQNATNNQYNIFINNLVIGPQQLRETLRGMMGQGFGAPANVFQAGTNEGLVTAPHVTGQKTATEVLPDDAVRANSTDQIKSEPNENQYIREDPVAPPGRKRKTIDNMEGIVPPLKLAPLAQNLTAEAVKEEVTEPRHRVMVVNYQTTDAISCQFVYSKQDKYGYTFDRTRSNPETNALFICNKRYLTHFTVNSDEEMANIRRVLETEEVKNFGWIQKFCIQRMKNRNAFICPISMNEEELMKCTVVATKAYIERGKGHEVGKMDLNETINSSEVLKNAIECSETMKEMQEGLNKKGKAILRKLIGKCSGVDK